MDNGGCQKYCDNSQGSFTCRCDDGYTLDVDGKACNGKLLHINVVKLLSTTFPDTDKETCDNKCLR